MDSETYDELHGSNNWDGLLQPLDLGLRTLILSYGDLASASERVLNDDQGTKYAGYSRYGKSSFFQQLMYPSAAAKYDVVSFIYATASINSDLAVIIPGMSRDGSEFESNWMGYVAVANDEFSKSVGRREICVVWRGMMRKYELISGVLGAMPVSAAPLLPAGKNTATDDPQVMGGWLSIYDTSDPSSPFVKSSARAQLSSEIKKLLEKYKQEKVSISCIGHSLGGCLAVLSSFDLAANIATPETNVSAFVFGCPQVGNEAFKATVAEVSNLKVLRVTNKSDLIPLWPSRLIKQIDEYHWVTEPGLLEYVDIGIEILIDTQKSPYVKEGLPVGAFHDLEGMLHAVGGWNGEDGEFDWSLVKRSLGLLNKYGDMIKDEFKVPVTWWAQKNKGMVLNEDGDWIIEPIDPEDHDLPSNINELANGNFASELD